MNFILLLLKVFLFSIEALASNSGLHLPIYRRGGRFIHHKPANFTTLTSTLLKLESRYSRTYRDVDDNRLVRKWNDGAESYMLDEAGLPGRWYTKIQVGTPPQTLEIDLDMLGPDFYTIMTTSEQGSKYDTFSSSTHSPNDNRVHPLCRNPSDVFHFPQVATSIRLDFPTCNPPKSSRHTISPSGTILGLGPSKSLARLTSPPLLDQLFNQSIIPRRILSLTLLDSETGILSLGSTIARDVEEAKIRSEVELAHLDSPSSSIEQEVQDKLNFAMPAGSNIDAHFKWIGIQGAASGWWTTLMAGVWINGAKVLKNQPVLLDINCPFILAPPMAARHFYDSIAGARPVGELFTSEDAEERSSEGEPFFAFPCLNTVNIAFEIAGWNFPVLSAEGTRADALYGPAGGRFSLGKARENGTGYCVGIVVETNMGAKSPSSGMQETWVLGEPFFRGLGLVFDMDGTIDGKGPRIGVRSY